MKRFNLGSVFKRQNKTAKSEQAEICDSSLTVTCKLFNVKTYRCVCRGGGVKTLLVIPAWTPAGASGGWNTENVQYSNGSLLFGFPMAFCFEHECWPPPKPMEIGTK